MPLYTYNCTNCDTTVEKRQSFSDPPLTTCEACGGTLRKVIHPVGIVFKGSGWYVTDSRSSSKAANGSAAKKDGENKGETSSSTESTSTSTESKPSSTDSSSSNSTTPAASSTKS